MNIRGGFKAENGIISKNSFEKGNNVVVIAPDVSDIFPDSESVNEALRALATVIRHRHEASIKS